jgi:hypothetical protein
MATSDRAPTLCPRTAGAPRTGRASRADRAGSGRSAPGAPTVCRSAASSPRDARSARPRCPYPSTTADRAPLACGQHVPSLPPHDPHAPLKVRRTAREIEAVLRTVGRAPDPRSPTTTCGFRECRLAPVSRSGRRAIGRILGGWRLAGWSQCVVRQPGWDVPNQGGEEADGLGGLLFAEGDVGRLCQLDPLVVQTITGRLSQMKPVPPRRDGPRRNPSLGWCPADSPSSPHRRACPRRARLGLPWGLPISLPLRGTERIVVIRSTARLKPRTDLAVPVVLCLLVSRCLRSGGQGGRVPTE